MFEGLITLCFIYVAYPNIPEECTELPFNIKFATKAECDYAAQEYFRYAQEVSRVVGHQITKLEHKCWGEGDPT